MIVSSFCRSLLEFHTRNSLFLITQQKVTVKDREKDFAFFFNFFYSYKIDFPGNQKGLKE
ncbi:MAG: hypothetical protein AMJ89_01480 [candidate division Zixibacteria bacterium SM23_73]|nr:MAG: hypothetical protein AMJ89_01480 [candidate division Zixibacteria bacterium SM23_73]